MLILRSVGIWRLQSNCLKSRACSGADGIRFKSAWIKEVWNRDGSTQDSTGQQSAEEIDVESLFIDGRVQRLLKNLIGMDIDKVYSERIISATERKHYALMTDDMIANIRSKMKERAKLFQQFVPVKEPRSSIPTVLENEEGLNGFDTAKFVFTDTTFDATNRNRIVVVREPNGILRTSTPEEHDRMNRTYYPSEEKPVLEPGVFSDPSFTEALKGNRHEIVLDWACHFFEPDDPRYPEVCTKVFEEIAEKKKLGVLRSTRHFGTMVFYLVLNKHFSPLLNYFATTRNLADVANAIRLIKVMHPDLPIPSIQGQTYVKIIEIFLNSQKTLRKQLPDLISLMNELEEAEKPSVKSA